MAEISENAPTKLPDHASVEAVLSRLRRELVRPFWRRLGSLFRRRTSTISIGATRARCSDGTRIAEYRPWMEAELAKDNGDIPTVWRRLQDT